MRTYKRTVAAILGSGIVITWGLANEDGDRNSSASTSFDSSASTSVNATATHDPVPTEPVTFLGVEVREVDPVLVDHLDLDEGVGLVVERVTDDSPASRAGLQENDILVKMGDQLLITPRQFTVLVRRERPDAEVAFEILRKGKRSTIRAALETREVPIRRAFDWIQGTRLPVFDLPLPPVPPEAGHFEDIINDELVPFESGAGRRIVAIDPRRKMVFRDRAGTVEVEIDGPERVVVIKDDQGNVVYQGDGSPDHHLPPEVKARMEKLDVRVEGDLDRLPHPPIIDVIKNPAAPTI
ncbi:MAG: PDZ domain-containing protein [Opitutaceae bacterium]